MCSICIEQGYSKLQPYGCHGDYGYYCYLHGDQECLVEVLILINCDL